MTVFYRGCQKNVPVLKRFFLQPLMPQFGYWEHYDGKRYKMYYCSSPIFKLELTV
jgi:hypothetical protein